MLKKLSKFIILKLNNFRDKLLQISEWFISTNRNIRIGIIAASMLFIISIIGISLHYINKNHNINLNKKLVQKYKHHSSHTKQSLSCSHAFRVL